MDLPARIVRLEHADFIRRARDPEEVYQFKHALVQDSAYGSLLHADRRNLHRACAQALELTYADALDEFAALLEQHYAKAGDDRKTFEYARRAGDAAMRVHAHTEAIAHYDTAAMLAARLPLTTEEFLEIHLRRGRTLELAGKYAEAVESYRALEEMGKTRGDTRLELGALLPLITLYIFPNPVQDLVQAENKNARALALARENHDQESEARILWNRQQHAYFTGQNQLAVAFSREALALADRLGLRELRGYILNDVSRALMETASVGAALAALDEARGIWRETNNLPMLVDNLSTSAGAAQVGGELDSAEKFSHEAQEVSRTIGNLWNLAYSSGPLLQIRVLRGEITKALALIDAAVGLARSSGFFLADYFASIERAMIYGEMGKAKEGLEVWNGIPNYEAFPYFKILRSGTLAYLHLLDHDPDAAERALEHAQEAIQSDDLSNAGAVYANVSLAELALRDGRYGDAHALTERIVERMRALGIRFYLPCMLLERARAQYGLGDTDAAEQTCLDAEALAQSMRARPIWWQVLALRAELAQAGGNTELASALRGQARELIEWIAGHAPADLDSSFRARPAVRVLLNG